MAEDLLPDDFRALDGPLLLQGKDGVAPIELAVESVESLPGHRLRAAPFSLILRGPRTPLLVQATYTLRHPRRGVLEMFLVPIAQDAKGARYEATFN